MGGGKSFGGGKGAVTDSPGFGWSEMRAPSKVGVELDVLSQLTGPFGVIAARVKLALPGKLKGPPLVLPPLFSTIIPLSLAFPFCFFPFPLLTAGDCAGVTLYGSGASAIPRCPGAVVASLLSNDLTRLRI